MQESKENAEREKNKKKMTKESSENQKKKRSEDAEKKCENWKRNMKKKLCMKNVK